MRMIWCWLMNVFGVVLDLVYGEYDGEVCVIDEGYVCVKFEVMVIFGEG